MNEVPDLKSIEKIILDYLSEHKIAIAGLEDYIRTVSSYKNVLQSSLVYLMLDAGVYDFELNAEKAKDVSHYDVVVKPSENGVVISILFPNQKIEDVL